MQYHALSLLQNDHNVVLIGYAGSSIIEPLLPFLSSSSSSSPTLRIHRYTPPNFKSLPTLLRLPLRLFSLIFSLSYALATSPNFNLLLVQNPPSIPTLLVSFLFCRFCCFKFHPAIIIDWHNLGFTMFSGDDNSFITKTIKLIARVYEGLLGGCSDGNFYVTARMKTFVQEKLGGTQGEVLYDCPPSNVFKTLHWGKQEDLEVIHDLFTRLENTEECFKTARKKFRMDDGSGSGNGNGNSTLFTRKSKNGKIERLPNAPKLLVSSTSWTPDEDFGILLSALIELQSKISNSANSGGETKIMLLVTGKGPQKALYQNKIKQLELDNVAIGTIWLETIDYPRLLASCDLGVCLHTSTSGIDLPMKVVDMYGSGIPVFAYDYQCISELVKDGVNGMVFEGGEKLAELFYKFLVGNGEEDGLEKLRDNVRRGREGGGGSWERNWEDNGGLREVKRCLLIAKEREFGGLNLYVFLMVGLVVVGVIVGGNVSRM